MNEAAFLQLRISCCDPHLQLQGVIKRQLIIIEALKEGIFDQMPDFVEVFVILALMLSVFLAAGMTGVMPLVFGLV